MKYKTVMLDMESYAKLSDAKRALRKKSGLKISFRDLILDLIGRRLDFAPVDDRLKIYIERFVAEMSRLESMEGILLFGSVAKCTYNEYSDIDIVVLVRHGKVNAIRKALTAVKSMKKEGGKLMELGLPSLINPIVLDLDDIKAFRSFYFDFADYGIILYERGAVLSDFIYSLKWKRHKREFVNNVEVLTW